MTWVDLTPRKASGGEFVKLSASKRGGGYRLTISQALATRLKIKRGDRVGLAVNTASALVRLTFGTGAFTVGGNGAKAMSIAFHMPRGVELPVAVGKPAILEFETNKPGAGEHPQLTVEIPEPKASAPVGAKPAVGTSTYRGPGPNSPRIVNGVATR